MTVTMCTRSTAKLFDLLSVLHLLLVVTILPTADAIPNPNGPACHSLRSFDCDGGTVGNPTDDQVYFAARAGHGMTCSDLVTNKYPYICKQTAGTTCTCQPPFIGGVCRENFLGGYIEFEGYWETESCDDSYNVICQNENACNNSRRNLLTEKDSQVVDEILLQSHNDACGSTEYDVFLHVVDSHLYAVAMPHDEGETALDCPVLATHAVFDTPASPARKEILLWENRAQAWESSTFLGRRNDSSSSSTPQPLHMTRLPFSDLVRAYQQVDPHPTAVYNIMSNNCATFLLSLASFLNVTIENSRVTSYVARRLMEDQSQELYHRIRTSISLLQDYESLFPQWGHRLLRGDDKIDDNELVELFVEKSLSVFDALDVGHI